MKIFLDPEDEVEIKPVLESDDKGLVILPTPIIKPERHSDLQKELAAIDALDTSIRDAESVHGIARSSVARYANGEGLSEDSQTRVMAHKYQIQDTAVAKLMQTLDLLDPTDLAKPRDKIALMTGLSQLIERTSGKNGEGNKTVHLHLYGPQQKKEKDYEVIEA